MNEVLDDSVPIIGVSGNDPLASYGISAMIAQLKAQGAYPVILPHDSARAGALLDGLDGLVVLGNPCDIDPADYGQENARSQVPDSQEYRNRMAFEKVIVEEALQRKMPLLGVCGGMQRMNVGGGEGERGTLHQHIEGHMEADNPFTPIQFIRLEEDSRLAALAKGVKGYFAPVHAELPDNVILENSLHHQAVDKIREGFRSAAVAPDGIVEAIEPSPDGKFAGQWALGVQWHPEVATSPVSQVIVKNFVSASSAYNKGHAHKHHLEALIPSSVIHAIAQGKDSILSLFGEATQRGV